LAVITIRPATETDQDAIWQILHDVVAGGDSFVFDPQISREEALALWFGPEIDTFVAEEDRQILGSYILLANQPGLGAHVANAGYMVAKNARGRGIARKMCEHSLNEARRLGFRAMQFNFVVSTNESAVHLWKEFGFEIVGTLPGAFRHAQTGYVDAYVMFRSL
jgi:ribosomal protein S18 acetylase RimI-like enzyme